jgi:glycine C-acetyltransferase
MPIDRLQATLAGELAELADKGTRKGEETVFRAVVPASGPDGPRFLLEGEGDRHYLRMNSNSYLGMSLRDEVIEAEERGSRDLGVGAGAVR